MTDEEFLAEHPICEFVRIQEQDGTVIAVLRNPNILSGRDAGSDEWHLSDLIRQLREFQRMCPQDARNNLQLPHYVNALKAVQDEKIRLDMPLDSPRLNDPPTLTLLDGGLASGPSF